MQHKLLQRQIQKHLSGEPIPEKFMQFLETVNASYERFENSKIMLERAIEISSSEMIALNNAQRKANETLKTLFENIDDVFFTTDLNTNNVLLISPVCEKLYGYKPEDFYTNPTLWYDMVIREDKVVFKNLALIKERGVPCSFEYRVKHADGTIKWIETKVTPFANSSNNLYKINGVSTDITSKKEAEIKLKESRELFSAIIESSHDLIQSVDKSGRFIFVNNSWKTTLGYTNEELAHKNIFEIISPEHHPFCMGAFQRVMSGETLRNFNTVFLAKDGREIQIEGNVVPQIKNGEVIATQAFFTDVTEKLKIEQEKQVLINELKQSEEHFHSLFSNARDPILLYSNDLNFFNCNDAAVKILGASDKTQILGKHPKLFSPEYQLDGTLSSEKIKLNEAEAYLEGSTQFEWTHQRLDGTLFSVDVSLTKILMGNKEILLVHWRDITAYKLACQRLDNANRQLTTKAEKNIEFQKTLLSLTSSKNYTLKARLEEIVKADAIALNIARVSIWLYNEDHSAIKCESLYIKNDDCFQDGMVLYENDFPNYFNALAKNRVIAAKNAHTHAATSEFSAAYLTPLGIMSMLDIPIRLEGKIIGVVCHEQTEVMKEWTEEEQLFTSSIADMVTIEIESSIRKEAQEKLAKQNEELQKSNTELDRFVYSVSHDLRAPLSSMLGIINIATEDTQDELMLNYLKMMSTNVKKLDGFITDILDYSRNARQEANLELSNLKLILGGIIENLKFIGGNTRRVSIQIDVDDDFVFVSDKGRLNIILNNLIANGIRYQNPDVSNPWVHVSSFQSNEETVIVIRDNGIGIKPEAHEKIFDMFYRVSEKSVGSGLGLYIVKESINKLNGKIELTSKVGEGSSFTIRLPIISK